MEEVTREHLAREAPAAMIVSHRLPLSGLIELCRALRHYLGAGLSLHDVFRQQAARGSSAVRAVAARISDGLEAGDDLEDALKKEASAFPPLFVALATVGEETGMLPEVFRELEKYYQLQQRLARQFRAQIAWPAFQFFAAVFVVAGLIWILGLLGGAFDPIGLGTGGARAVLFLFIVFGLLGGALACYGLAKRALREGTLDALLLRLPVVGPCLRALAITRFCLALRLTLESGMPIARALRLSFRATGNGAFAAAADTAQQEVKAGEELTVALARTRLFPVEFEHVIEVGEESGRLTEVLEQQGGQYAEESERRLAVLTSTAAWGVWVFVAGLIIFCIFRIALTYIDMLDPAHYGL
jgi:type IV pilus assembly protein PilC